MDDGKGSSDTDVHSREAIGLNFRIKHNFHMGNSISGGANPWLPPEMLNMIAEQTSATKLVCHKAKLLCKIAIAYTRMVQHTARGP